jgi:hypothetical protein
LPGFDVGREPRGLGVAALGLRSFVVEVLSVAWAVAEGLLVRVAVGAARLTVAVGRALGLVALGALVGVGLCWNTIDGWGAWLGDSWVVDIAASPPSWPSGGGGN